VLRPEQRLALKLSPAAYDETSKSAIDAVTEEVKNLYGVTTPAYVHAIGTAKMFSPQQQSSQKNPTPSHSALSPNMAVY